MSEQMTEVLPQNDTYKWYITYIYRSYNHWEESDMGYSKWFMADKTALLNKREKSQYKVSGIFNAIYFSILTFRATQTDDLVNEIASFFVSAKMSTGIYFVLRFTQLSMWTAFVCSSAIYLFKYERCSEVRLLLTGSVARFEVDLCKRVPIP